MNRGSFLPACREQLLVLNASLSQPVPCGFHRSFLVFPFQPSRGRQTFNLTESLRPILKTILRSVAQVDFLILLLVIITLVVLFLAIL